jgi:hypothetical protein
MIMMIMIRTYLNDQSNLRSLSQQLNASTTQHFSLYSNMHSHMYIGLLGCAYQ